MARARNMRGDWVRPAVVAGTWYPGTKKALAETVDTYLAEVTPVDGHPLALIVPHAGYAYSGKVAATGFKQLEGGDYQVAVVVAADHQPPISRPISVWARGGFETPLGVLPVDEGVAGALVNFDPCISFDPKTHAGEHAIEIELPFLQRAAPGCRIVPVLMGAHDPDTVKLLTQALVSALTGKRAVIVASSDLSHYPNYQNARQVDMATLDAIETGDPGRVRKAVTAGMGKGVPGLATCACGAGPIMVALQASKEIGADTVTILQYTNSGEGPGGDRGRVVGYGAVMTTRYQPPELTPAHRSRLLHLAHDTLAAYLETGIVPRVDVEEEALKRRAGVFLTLRKEGELRGCIGHMDAEKPLYRAVQDTVISAATQDPRFAPVELEELETLHIQLSVLSPLRRVLDIQAIEIGVHGLVLEMEGQRGVLLPGVPANRGWDRETFLENLCYKAGLPEGAWRGDAKLYAFTTIEFGDATEPPKAC